ncbi:MAG TPA: tetratricopeptide repeat protein [Candidatus Limnocylindrales bacterium]|nr:tetratricopeptide repeat protein [Candidatus Limnocylindrales bacterium]
MWKKVSQFLLVVLFSLSCFGQRISHQNAGTPYFVAADKQLAANPGADVIALIRQGWAATQQAGAADQDYATGVESTTRMLSVLNRDLEADGIVKQALAACNTPALALVRAQVLIRHSENLLRRRDLVLAGNFMKESVAREEASGTDPQILLAMKMLLASIEEQRGNTNEAEQILKATLDQGKPSVQAGRRQEFIFQQRLPYFGEPYPMLAALYSRHERTAEAEQIYRDRAASTQADPQEHVLAIRQLAQVLASHGQLEEAMKLQEEILQQEAAQGQPANTAGDEATLASYQIRAGQKEEGMRLLHSELDRAAAVKGTSSYEYQSALNNLIQNAIEAGELDLAEKMARDALERAQASTGNDTGPVITSMNYLAQVLRAKGDTKTANELNQQITEMGLRNVSGRAGELQRAFAEVPKLNNEGKTADAMAAVETIASTYYPFQTDELWQFIQSAYSFLNTPQHKAEATRVAEVVMSLVERENLGTDPRSASLLAQWANVYGGFLGDSATAEKLLQRAEDLIRECCGEQSPRMDAVLRDRVSLTKERQDRITALEKLRDFEVQVFGVNGQDAENTNVMLAQSYMSSGKWEMAQQAYAAALAASSTRDGKKTSHYVNLMGRVAMEFLNYGRYQAALEMNQQALTLSEGVLYADRIRPNLERVQQQILERMAQPVRK